MTRTLQIAMLLAVIIYFVIVLHLLKRKSLNLKYTLLWILSGIVMLALSIFPQILNWMANLVGIYSPTNALFAVVSFCIIIILMSLTAIASRLNDKSKRLTQEMALLEKRIRELEKMKTERDLNENEQSRL